MGRAGQWIEALERRLEEPTDVAALAMFRALVGLLILTGALRFIACGWVDRFFVQPTFTFKFWGFEWVQLPPPQAMHGLFWGISALALCVALGLFYRVAIVGLFVCFTYVELLDVTNYLNHYYLLILLTFLMIFLPLNRAHSLDALIWPGIKTTHLPAWMTWLLRAQVGAVYVFAGLAKFGEDWLLHAQPLNIWLSARTETPLVGPWLDLWWVALAMSWGGFLYDTTIPFWLMWERTRPFAFAILVAFHAAVGVLFNIGMFPLIMVSAATIFFSPSWPRRVVPGLGADPEAPQPRAPKAPERARLRAALALAGLYCLIQVVMPLRSVLYPGEVLWHEQGMRWAWRVMVREKNGAVMYRVHLPDKGWDRLVPPSRYLSDHQAREMSGQPDMILQLGQHIGRDFQSKGHRRVEVRVDAQVSLNGRPAQPLIDPEVDLMTIEDGLAPAAWILPGPDTPPIRLRRPSAVAKQRQAPR